MIKTVFNNDKIAHLSVNYLIVLLSKCAGLLIVGLTIATIISIGKELYDKYIKKTFFEWEDIQADVLGMLMASL